MSLPKLLKSTVKIRFQDCDPYNHLNNSRYVDYFMNAREDHVLDAYDLDVYRMGRDLGIAWVVAFNQIAYLRPAFLMEKVHITSQVIKNTDSWMVVEFRMHNAETGALKTLMWTKYVHVDIQSGKSHKHSEELMEMFEQVVLPVEADSFEERLAVARKGQLALSQS